MSFRCFVVSVLAVACLSWGIPGAADAATRTVKDRSGEAPVQVDVVRAKLANRDDRLVATVRLRRLQARVPNVYVEFEADADNAWTYMFMSSFWRNGKYRTYIAYEDALGFNEYQCSGTKARWNPGRRGTVKFTIPRECVGLPATVDFRGGAAIEGEVADRTRRITVAQG